MNRSSGDLGLLYSGPSVSRSLESQGGSRSRSSGS
jgi:hypothetical protein